MAHPDPTSEVSQAAATDQRIRLILGHLKPSDRVLDIGCAHHSATRAADPHWLHQHIAQKCAETTGLELEAAEAEQLNAIGYRVVAGNVEERDLVESTGADFDAVVAGEIIEHLGNPGRFLENMERLIRPGGKLILTTPNAWNFFNIASTVLRNRIPIHEQHTCWYDETTLGQLLGRYAFDVLEFEYLHWMQGQKGRSISMLLHRMGLKKLAGAGLFFVLQRR